LYDHMEDEKPPAMESRTKMGQKRFAVRDDFYVFPVGAVY
jgi:hypothetical protein